MAEPDSRPAIEIQAGIDYFDQATWDAARAELAPVLRVGGGVAFQFSEFVPPNVVISVGISFVVSVFTGVVSNALYDVLRRHFLRTQEPLTRITFRVEEEDTTGMRHRRVAATVTTADQTVLREAMATLRTVATNDSADSIYVFDPVSSAWIKHNPSP